MTAVRFIRDRDRYMRGEVAGFRPDEAERLVRRNIARLYRQAAEASAPATSPVDVSTPSAPEALQGCQSADAVEIPDGWRDLSWPARRSLASMLTDSPIVTAEDAERAILAELACRGR